MNILTTFPNNYLVSVKRVLCLLFFTFCLTLISSINVEAQDCTPTASATTDGNPNNGKYSLMPSDNAWDNSFQCNDCDSSPHFDGKDCVKFILNNFGGACLISANNNWSIIKNGTCTRVSSVGTDISEYVQQENSDYFIIVCKQNGANIMVRDCDTECDLGNEGGECTINMDDDGTVTADCICECDISGDPCQVNNPGDGTIDSMCDCVCNVGEECEGDGFTGVLNADCDCVKTLRPIPTLGEWGLILLGLSLVIFGIVAVRQRETILVFKR